MHLMQMAFLSLHGLIDVASFLAVAVVPAFADDLAVANMPISHKLLLALLLLLTFLLLLGFLLLLAFL